MNFFSYNGGKEVAYKVIKEKILIDKRKLKKFFKRIVLDKAVEVKSGEGHVRVWGSVPQKRNLKNKSGFIRIIELNKDIGDLFIDVYKDFRKEDDFEYLDNKELWDALWEATCDIYLESEEYKNFELLSVFITNFLEGLIKPIEEFIVYVELKKLYLDFPKSNLWDFSLNTMNDSLLSSIGIEDLDFKNVLKEKTFMGVLEKGNNLDLVKERARSRCYQNLNLIRFYLSSALSSVRHGSLDFHLGDYVIIKDKNSEHRRISHQSKNNPLILTSEIEDEDLFLEMNDHYVLFQSLSFELRKVLERASFWIGKSIHEIDLDAKIVAVCTALETLLTKQNDGLKGHMLVYRMVLMNTMLEERFTRPSIVLGIYELRCSIVHGSNLFIATKSHYRTILYEVRRLYINFLKMASDKKLKKQTEVFELLNRFDSDKEMVVLKWFEEKYPEIGGEIKQQLEF